MANPEIMWTFLPNGMNDKRLKFSAAVSIRLPGAEGSNPNLGLFPEVLKWADTVKALEFDVQFDKAAPVRLKRTSPDPDPDLWNAIFQPSSPVYPFKFNDLSLRTLFSFPVKHVQSFLAQQYINMAAESPDEPPAIERMFRTEALGQIRLKPITNPRFTSAVQLKSTEPVMAQRVRAQAENGKVRAVVTSAKPEPAQDFFLLKYYHQPKNKTVTDPKTKASIPQRTAIKPPELDFHQACSHLANFPALMRLLGLILDFEVEPPAKAVVGGSARIIPSGRPADKTPWTKYTINAASGAFIAASEKAKPEAVNGFLDLTDGDTYDIVQVDVDGAALKTAALADNADVTSTGDLPALRSGGMSVVRTGNAEYLARFFKASAEKNAAASKSREQTFYAEDLVQGYRIDVWDEKSAKWYSLCRRVGTYNFLRNGRTVSLEDEGFISESVTESADGSSSDLFAHESLFTWNGWSLVAERPGKTIDANDKPVTSESKAATDFRLETKFKPPAGSLPRLRIGNRYRLRARVVDLAGNSVGPGSADTAQAIPAPGQEAAEYSRFDPVPPPTIVLRAEAGRGEAVDNVVIRSYNDSIDKDIAPCGETSDRHVMPPKTSQLGAEICGMFDAEGGGLRKDFYSLMATKDPGALKEIEPGETIDLPYFPDPWAKGVVVRGLPGEKAGALLKIEFSGTWPDLKGFRLKVAEGDRAADWSDGSRILTVYLKKSDVVTLRLSCWFPEPALPRLGLYKWLEKPEMVIPASIQQTGRATGPILVAPIGLKTSDEVKAEAEAAEAAKRASFVKPEAVHPAATVHPIAAGHAAQIKPGAVQAEPVKTAVLPAAQIKPVFQLPKIDLAAIKAAAVSASHWMMTPYRTVTLMHAVQQPLGKPGAVEFGVTRGLGKTYAVFDAQLTVHGSSSQKFEMSADWQEPVDSLSEKKWRTINGQAHVLEQQLERGMVKFTMGGETPMIRTGFTMRTLPNEHRHEFGDTKYRRVNYTLTETTRFKEQMPESMASSPEVLIRKSDKLTIDVPNAAPPAMPKVVYIVPTFGWERKRDHAKFTSIRKGGGLRVYLERPWFSSGDGELLGVVLPPTPGVKKASDAEIAAANALTMAKPAGTPTPAKPVQARTGAAAVTAGTVQAGLVAAPLVTDALRPYVTMWGMDPLWRAGSIRTPEYPLPGDFPLAQEVLGGLAVPDLPGRTEFTAVGHKVEYDEDRGLWFCDVEIDPHDAYFPFVRLALARFQPISVKGAYLSKVTTADFIQLAPDRTVSMVFNKPNVAVTVGGASYIQAAAGSGPGEMTAVLERHNVNLPKELGWSEVAGTEVVLTTQRAATAGVGSFIWNGKIEIPKGMDIKNCRVTVREFETFIGDGVEKMQTGKTISVAAAMPKKVKRLVFAETFSLADL